MPDKNALIQRIKNDFIAAQALLKVIGDQTRQAILMELMEADCQQGMCVGEITKRADLSRPAVSHQLKILKDLGIVEMKEEGTKNYYYIDIYQTQRLFQTLKTMATDIENLMEGMEE